MLLFSKLLFCKLLFSNQTCDTIKQHFATLQQQKTEFCVEYIMPIFEIEFVPMLQADPYMLGHDNCWHFNALSHNVWQTLSSDECCIE
jgi:hypothetical protein